MCYRQPALLYLCAKAMLPKCGFASSLHRSGCVRRLGVLGLYKIVVLECISVSSEPLWSHLVSLVQASEGNAAKSIAHVSSRSTYTYTRLHTYTYMHIDFHICKHIYIYTYIHIYVCTYIHVYIYIYMYLYIYTFIHLYIYIYKYRHFHIYSCIYICIYIYIYR